MLSDERIEAIGIEQWSSAKSVKEFFVNFARAIEAERSLPDWQTIETAPKDGTRFLAYCPKDGLVTVRWASHGWELYPDGGTEFYYEFRSQPTHWMPLPTPPASKGE